MAEDFRLIGTTADGSSVPVLVADDGRVIVRNDPGPRGEKGEPGISGINLTKYRTLPAAVTQTTNDKIEDVFRDAPSLSLESDGFFVVSAWWRLVNVAAGAQPAVNWLTRGSECHGSIKAIIAAKTETPDVSDAQWLFKASRVTWELDYVRRTLVTSQIPNGLQAGKEYDVIVEALIQTGTVTENSAIMFGMESGRSGGYTVTGPGYVKVDRLISRAGGAWS